MSLKIIGILNVTPDSFSDGGNYYSHDSAIKHGLELIQSGADIIEIGGDSTRPSSTCIGAEEEWSRIGPVIAALKERCIISVDTHHAATAKKALQLGVSIINDVSAGYDPSMFKTVAEARAKIIIMYSRCGTPHQFDKNNSSDILLTIKEFLTGRVAQAQQAGIDGSNIILDSGFGAFISDFPSTSWELLGRYHELVELNFPLCFASSRKGFLKCIGEKSPADRDIASALTAALALNRTGHSIQYIRTHNPKLTHDYIKISNKL